MVGKKPKQPVKIRRVEPAPEARGFYEKRLAPFLARYSLLLAVCLVTAASARIVATYSQLSLTVDEPGHFACGLEYLSRHVYEYESQHPPLARAMSALGPYLDGVRLRGHLVRNAEGVDVVLHSPNPQRTVALMRLGILPFFWLASLVVFVWARRDFGRPVAVMATGLFTLIPPVLAHSGLATTDMALAACAGAAFFTLILWAESPTWQHSLLLGAASALAVLSKFTALGFLPAAAVAALLFYLAVKWPGWRKLASLAKERAAMFALAVLTGALVVWACYWFSFGKMPGWNVSLPAHEFFDGISVAMRHNEGGHPAYLLGANSAKGWWYYFPVVLAVKTPIAFLLLLGWGAWLCWRNRARPGFLLPLAFSLGILLMAMSGNVNIGVRHILPVYMGFAIVAGLALAHLLRAGFAGALPGSLLLIWMAASGAIQHPDYLSYFNEFVGSMPEKVLVDSDLDWGQDLIRLSKRLRELGVKKIAFEIFGEPAVQQLYGLPPCERVNNSFPTEVWTVIGPTLALSTPFVPTITGTDFASLSKGMSQTQPWFERIDPTERVGALLLFKMPANSVQPR